MWADVDATLVRALVGHHSECMGARTRKICYLSPSDCLSWPSQATQTRSRPLRATAKASSRLPFSAQLAFPSYCVLAATGSGLKYALATKCCECSVTSHRIDPVFAYNDAIQTKLVLYADGTTNIDALATLKPLR